MGTGNMARNGTTSCVFFYQPHLLGILLVILWHQVLSNKDPVLCFSIFIVNLFQLNNIDRDAANKTVDCKNSQIYVSVMVDPWFTLKTPDQ